MSAIEKIMIAFRLFGLLLINILLVACAGKTFTYMGRWVAEDDRIVLQAGGPHKGNWQTRDLAIEYNYEKETQTLQISGAVTLGDHLTTGFNSLDYLTLDIFALDADGIILNSELLRTFGYRRSMVFLDKMTFNRQIGLPDGTSAIGFGYRGRATQGGRGLRTTRDGDRIDWDFWKIPGRKPAE
ncbi:MAG: hypothetical protein JSW26_11905 [Desulfobacterales bacterium]|nr:MAG: hypothetical protein JSW26_11905 [Desulfobacterales bacterium]